MQGTVLYGPRDVRFEDRPEPKITKPTDAVIRLSATCICGSDLWTYYGNQSIAQPTPMGHEYCGIVEEVGKKSKEHQAGPVRGRLVCNFRLVRLFHSLVGSRTGAMLRRFDLSVAPRFLWECLHSQTVSSFPVPASSNPSCRSTQIDACPAAESV